MIDKLAGLPTQIRQLEKRLKEMDASKVKPAMVKEITDTIQNLKNLLKEKMDKREERRKAKEQAAAPAEVEKEAISVPNAADVGAVSQNAPAPAATPGAPEATPDDQKVSCPLCGGMTFNDNATYQQHMAYTHASDIMPTNPGQKLDKTVASTEPAPVEKESRFKLDAEVKPIRGSDSKGKVMRWDGKDNDLVYVMWNEGALKDRDGFGGYYPHDLELIQAEQPIEANGDTNGQPPHNPGPEHICPECKDWHDKHADLKTNYQGFLDDLKQEYKLHYEQGNHAWAERLKQKIEALEKSMDEKFPKEAEKKCPTCGQPHNKDSYFADQVVEPKWEMKPGDKPTVTDELNKKEGGAQNAEDLTIMDHTPPQANSGPDAGGKDSHDEFQDEWAMPAGIELQSKMPKAQQKQLDALVQKAVYGYQINIMDMSKVYQAGEAAFIAGQDVTAAVHAFLDSMVASGKAMKTSALKAEPIKLAVFNKEFVATPLNTQEKLGGYDISQNGKKLFKINSKDGQPMSKEQLEFCAQIELTRGLKQAKLKAKIAFLEAGTDVYILAQDKAGKRIKFASMEHGLRGWAPVSKFAFQAKEGEMRKHKDHIDNTYGHNGKEILVDCPNGSGNLVWLPLNELLPIQAPPATPESLNDLEGKREKNWSVEQAPMQVSKIPGDKTDKLPHIMDDIREEVENTPPEPSPYFKRKPKPMQEEKESAKECPDCHGMFEGPEGATCPTCGRFAVQKEALKPQLPVATPNQRMDVNASGCDQCDASMINGVFCHETGCPNARKRNSEEDMDLESSLNKKATVVHREDGWHVLSEKGKNLGGPYKTKPEAVKRLRQVEYFKHHGALRPFSKKVIAEVMTDPYQTLTDHITDMRGRMDQVNERLQNAPAVKTAEDKAPEMDLAALFADLTQGINLLEEKMEDGDNHAQIEELENKLFKLEESCGITPKLSPEEKAEPEHKEIVKDIEEKKDEPAKKEADEEVDETVTTTNEPGLINSPSFNPNTPAPLGTPQNVQPTDDDNLEVPVVAPSSPPAPGQKWVFDTQFNKYVSMPDPDAANRTI